MWSYTTARFDLKFFDGRECKRRPVETTNERKRVHGQSDISIDSCRTASVYFMLFDTKKSLEIKESTEDWMIAHFRRAVPSKPSCWKFARTVCLLTISLATGKNEALEQSLLYNEPMRLVYLDHMVGKLLPQCRRPSMKLTHS